eukprot:8066531-Alexandrium_andersonii.AAC.1
METSDSGAPPAAPAGGRRGSVERSVTRLNARDCGALGDLRGRCPRRDAELHSKGPNRERRDGRA